MEQIFTTMSQCPYDENSATARFYYKGQVWSKVKKFTFKYAVAGDIAARPAAYMYLNFQIKSGFVYC